MGKEAKIVVGLLGTGLTLMGYQILASGDNSRVDSKNNGRTDLFITNAEKVNGFGIANIDGIEFKVTTEDSSYRWDDQKEDYTYDIRPTENGIASALLRLKLPTELRNTLTSRSHFLNFGSLPYGTPDGAYVRLSFVLEKNPDLLELDTKTGQIIPTEKLKAAFEEVSNRFQAAAKNPKAFQTASAAR